VTTASAAHEPARIEAPGANRFAFVLHPLTIDYLANHPRYRWTRHLPRGLVEAGAAHMPAARVGHVAGGLSPTTGQSVAGFIYALGATPRQMLNRAPEFTYRRLDRAVRDAAERGAQIVGLGAFTKVVGDAGITVAQRASIPVTTGNSLTIAATLETAKLTARRMGWADLEQARAMVVGATGAIGSVCSRLLAAAVHDVVLVSIEPDRLIALKAKIEAETPQARVEIDTTTARRVGDCDLVVTATSAFGQRVLDVSQCKPGAVILDVALPPDISAEEAATRPDVLVVESGEVLIPGPVSFSFDIGLPPGVAYACLAEAALLAMEGRFESFTLGRDVPPAKVKEIYRLFRKHGFQIAPLRTFGAPLTDALVAAKNARAEELRRDPAQLQRVKAAAAAAIARIPPRAKGVSHA
jgi:predicted amino acid dehydrogenase